MAETEYSVAPSRSLPQTTFYSIEYPGYVSSTPDSLANAVQTLGGQSAVDKVFRQPRAKVLELKLRPDDLFAHPVPGEAVSTLKILTKVTTRRKRKKVAAPLPGSEASGDPMDVDHPSEDIDMNTADQPSHETNSNPWENEAVYTVEAVGIIPRTVRFRAMADFQFHPDSADPIVQLRQKMERLDRSTIDAIHGFRFDQEKEDYSLPLPHEIPSESQNDPTVPQTRSNLRLPGFPMFSRTTIPAQYNYKPNPFSTVEKVQNPETGEEVQRMINKTRFKGFGALAIDFADPGPVPSGLSPAMASTKPVVSADIMRRLTELFAQRPMWSRVALLNQFGMNERREIFNSKITLPLVSYAFNDGPFRDLHIRFGYDPRKDREARFYQRLTYRSQKTEARRKPILEGRNPASTRLTIFDMPHIFDSQVLDHVLAPGYQLCDIRDPLLERLINDKKDLRTECHIADGWYSAEAFSRIKTVMRRKLFGIIDTGRIVPDEECLAAANPKDVEAGEKAPAKSRRSKGQGPSKKRNKAKGAAPSAEDAAARLKRKVQKQAQAVVDDESGSEWEEDESD